MSDATKLAIDTLQNTIDCLMRENEKNDGSICDTIWYDNHTTLFDYINCELAALRAQPDHSELVTAARAVVERWETPLWKDAPATAGYINRLRDALPAIGETME